MSRALLALLCVSVLFAAPSRAFSPGPPRPVPSVVAGVCSNDHTTSCGFGNPCSGAGAECVADPAGLVPGVSVRGTLTLIVDEDVSGWSGGPDTTSGRDANARLTVLLEFTNNGTPFLIADTFQLGSTASVEVPGAGPVTCDVTPPSNTNHSALCVPGWTEPANEDNLTSSVQQLNIQWADVSDFRAAIVKALLSPTQQTQFPHALPLLEIVDPGDTSDHHGSDPLASIKRFKVTIVVAKGS
jgi:hypothetical protein